MEKPDKATVATMLAGMCTFLNVYSTQPLLPLLRQIFHASELEVSLTVSATIFATALTAPIIGMIAERRGRKKVIVPSLFLLAIPTALAATSTSLGALIFWRFAQGLFVPGVIAVMLAYVNEEWAGRGVGRAMSAYIAGTVVGGFLGRFISGVVAAHWNWRATFLVLAALDLIGAVLVRAWLPLAKNFVRAEHVQQVLSHAREHLRNPRLLANFGMGATVLFALAGCFTYANFYLAAAPFRLNSAQLGSIFFVYLLGAVITPQSGRFLDRFGFRHTTIVYCAMMIAGLLLTLVQSLPIVIVGLAIFSSGVFVAQAAATVQTGAIAGKARSSAAGLYVSFYYLGGSIGATLTDVFWRWKAWPGCVVLFAGVSLLSLWLARISSRPPGLLVAGNLTGMANKYTRLDSQFSIVSAFWAPDAVEVVYTGTLTSDERGLTFTTAPEYIPQTSATQFSSAMKISDRTIATLHGFTEEGPCTLCQLVEIGRPGLVYPLGQSVTATAYRATTCVTGMHLDGLRDKSLTSARYTFTGLSKWLPTATTETWENDYVLIRVPLKEKEILGCEAAGTRVWLKVVPELTSTETDNARLSRSVPFLEVESPVAESLSWYLDIGNRLENLFSLLTGTSLATETMFIYRGEESGHVIAKRTSHSTRFNPFDCVRPTFSQLANSITIWLGESSDFRSVENLALGVVRKGKLFIETEFLSLAQALEGFHRVTTRAVVENKAAFRQVRKKIVAMLKDENVDTDLAKRICDSLSHVNEVTFPSRLAELCSRISGPLLLRMGIDTEQFKANVVAMRNFYTHAGGSTRRHRGNILSTTELFFLNQKMRSLLRGVLLLHLGIPEAQLSDLLIREATRWR